MRNEETVAPIAVTVAITYTADGPLNHGGKSVLLVAAYTSPPNDGPRIVAAWKMLAFHATAFGKFSVGTNCGRIERLAVELNDRTTPTRTKTTYIALIDGAPRSVRNNNAEKHTAYPAYHAERTLLRSKRSDAWP